jgi:hypothetical protein
VDERLYVRWLLFGKGRGKSKNLSREDAKRVTIHIQAAYERYIMALVHGIDRRVCYRPANPIRGNPAHPLHYLAYRRMWYGRAKGTYIYRDVPKITKMRWEELSAKRNTKLPEQHAGKWLLELKREIGERKPGDVGLPVSELPGGIRGNEGWHSEQRPFQHRRKKTPGGDRQTSEVGA